MKKKISFASALVVMIAAAIIYPNLPKNAEVTLQAPRECRIGELVIFDASASEMNNITWDISPKTKNFKIIDNGKQAVFSSGIVEDYTVTIAVANQGKVHLYITKLSVLPNEFDQLIPDDFIPVDLLPDDLVPTDLVPSPLPRRLFPKTISIPVEVTIENLNLKSWLPDNVKSKELDKAIAGLKTLVNLIEKNRFESRDEIIQAVVWATKKAIQNQEDWEPFIMNLLNYLEDSSSEPECIQKVRNILAGLEEIRNA